MGEIGAEGVPWITPHLDVQCTHLHYYYYYYYYKDRKCFEKVGEATEVALKVLAEKVNVLDIDKSSLSKQQLATACMKAVQQQYKKVSPSPWLLPQVSMVPALGVHARVLPRQEVNECVLSAH